MFCTQCGTNNPDNALVCSRCGRSLQAAPPVPVQPGAIAPPAAAVENYLVFAILATILCCVPTGIVAIVYAAQVNGKVQSGDIAGAQAASKNAKMWCLISLGLGLAVVVIYGLLMMAGIMTGMHH